MANEDFYVKFGSNATKFREGLATEVTEISKLIVALKAKVREGEIVGQRARQLGAAAGGSAGSGSVPKIDASGLASLNHELGKIVDHLASYDKDLGKTVRLIGETATLMKDAAKTFKGNVGKQSNSEAGKEKVRKGQVYTDGNGFVSKDTPGARPVRAKGEVANLFEEKTSIKDVPRVAIDEAILDRIVVATRETAKNTGKTNERLDRLIAAVNKNGGTGGGRSAGSKEAAPAATSSGAVSREKRASSEERAAASEVNKLRALIDRKDRLAAVRGEISRVTRNEGVRPGGGPVKHEEANPDLLRRASLGSKSFETTFDKTGGRGQEYKDYLNKVKTSLAAELKGVEAITELRKKLTAAEQALAQVQAAGPKNTSATPSPAKGKAEATASQAAQAASESLKKIKKERTPETDEARTARLTKDLHDLSASAKTAGATIVLLQEELKRKQTPERKAELESAVTQTSEALKILERGIKKREDQLAGRTRAVKREENRNAATKARAESPRAGITGQQAADKIALLELAGDKSVLDKRTVPQLHEIRREFEAQGYAVPLGKRPKKGDLVEGLHAANLAYNEAGQATKQELEKFRPKQPTVISEAAAKATKNILKAIERSAEESAAHTLAGEDYRSGGSGLGKGRRGKTDIAYGGILGDNSREAIRDAHLSAEARRTRIRDAAFKEAAAQTRRNPLHDPFDPSIDVKGKSQAAQDTRFALSQFRAAQEKIDAMGKGAQRLTQRLAEADARLTQLTKVQGSLDALSKKKSLSPEETSRYTDLTNREKSLKRAVAGDQSERPLVDKELKRILAELNKILGPKTVTKSNIGDFTAGIDLRAKSRATYRQELEAHRERLAQVVDQKAGYYTEGATLDALFGRRNSIGVGSGVIKGAGGKPGKAKRTDFDTLLPNIFKPQEIKDQFFAKNPKDFSGKALETAQNSANNYIKAQKRQEKLLAANAEAQGKGIPLQHDPATLEAAALKVRQAYDRLLTNIEKALKTSIPTSTTKEGLRDYTKVDALNAIALQNKEAAKQRAANNARVKRQVEAGANLVDLDKTLGSLPKKARQDRDVKSAVLELGKKSPAEVGAIRDRIANLQEQREKAALAVTPTSREQLNRLRAQERVLEQRLAKANANPSEGRVERLGTQDAQGRDMMRVIPPRDNIARAQADLESLRARLEAERARVKGARGTQSGAQGKVDSLDAQIAEQNALLAKKTAKPTKAAVADATEQIAIERAREILAKAGVRWTAVFNASLNEAKTVEDLIKRVQQMQKAGTLQLSTYGLKEEKPLGVAGSVKGAAGGVVGGTGAFTRAEKILEGNEITRDMAAVKGKLAKQAGLVYQEIKAEYEGLEGLRRLLDRARKGPGASGKTPPVSGVEEVKAAVKEGKGKGFDDDCCTKIVAAINAVNQTLKGTLKISGTTTVRQGTPKAPGATGAIGDEAQRTANDVKKQRRNYAPLTPESVAAYEKMIPASVYGKADPQRQGGVYTKGPQGLASDKTVALGAALVAQGYGNQARVVDFLRQKLNLTAEAAANLEARLKSAVKSNALTESGTRGDKTSDRRAKIAALETEQDAKRAKTEADKKAAGEREQVEGVRRLNESYDLLNQKAKQYLELLKRAKTENLSAAEIVKRQKDFYAEASRSLRTERPAENITSRQARIGGLMSSDMGLGMKVPTSEVQRLGKDIEAELSKTMLKEAAGHQEASSGLLEALFGGKGFAGRVVSSMGTFLVRNFSAGIVFGITNALQDMIGQALETEATFIRVSSALEATGRSSGTLRTDLQAISTEYGVALKDVYTTASGLTGVFGNNKDLAAATRIAAQLESISRGALNSTEAMKALASVTTAYGLSSVDDLGHIADVLTVIQDRLGVNIEDTVEGVGRLAGQAKQLGLTFEETAVYVAAISKLTNQSGQAAGEQFSRILSQVQTGRGQAALSKGLGPQSGINEALATRDYSSALEILLDNYKGLNKAQKDNIAVTLGGARQAASINALLEQGAKVRDTVRAAEDARGEADKRAAEIAQTLNNEIKRLQQNFVNLTAALVRSGVLTFLGLVLKATNFLLGGLNTILSTINDIADSNPLTKFAKSSIGAILGLLLTIKLLGSAMRALKGVIPASLTAGGRAANLAESQRLNPGAAPRSFNPFQNFGTGGANPGPYNLNPAGPVPPPRPNFTTRVAERLSNFGNRATALGQTLQSTANPNGIAGGIRTRIGEEATRVGAGAQRASGGLSALGARLAASTVLAAGAAAAIGVLTIALTAVAFEAIRAAQFRKEQKEAYEQEADGKTDTKREEDRRYRGKQNELVEKNREALEGPSGFARALGRGAKNVFSLGLAYESSSEAAGDISGEKTKSGKNIDQALFQQMQKSFKRIRENGALKDIKGLDQASKLSKAEIDALRDDIQNADISAPQKATAQAELDNIQHAVSQSAAKMRLKINGLSNLNLITSSQLDALNSLTQALQGAGPSSNEFTTLIQSISEDVGFQDGSDYKRLTDALNKPQSQTERLQKLMEIEKINLQGLEARLADPNIDPTIAEELTQKALSSLTRYEQLKVALLSSAVDGATAISNELRANGDTDAAVSALNAALTALDAEIVRQKDDPAAVAALQARRRAILKQQTDLGLEPASLAAQESRASTRNQVTNAQSEFDEAQRQVDAYGKDPVYPEGFIGPKAPGSGATEAEKSAARQRLETARKALSDAKEAERAAAAETSIIDLDPGDIEKIARARLTEAIAAQTFAEKFGKSSTQYQSATQAVTRALREVDNAVNDILAANSELDIAIADAAGDRVAVARKQAAEAERIYQQTLKQAGGNTKAATVVRADAARVRANAASRDAQLNDAIGTVDFQLEMGEITANTAIQILQELLKQTNLTEEQRRQLKLKIKGLQADIANTLTGSGFNIPGEIKLPTAYEVRRSLGIDPYLKAGNAALQDIQKARVASASLLATPTAAGATGATALTGNTTSTNVTNNTTVNNTVSSPAMVEAVAQRVVALISGQTMAGARANQTTPALVRY